MCCAMIVFAGAVFYACNKTVPKKKVVDKDVFSGDKLPEELQKDLYFKDYINKAICSEEKFVGYNQQKLENGLVFKVVTTSTQKENTYHFYIAFQQREKLRLPTDYFAVSFSDGWTCESGNVELFLEEKVNNNEKCELKKIATVEASQWGYAFCIPEEFRKKAIYYGYTNFEAVRTSKEAGNLYIKYIRNSKRIVWNMQIMNWRVYINNDNAIQTYQATFNIADINGEQVK